MTSSQIETSDPKILAAPEVAAPLLVDATEAARLCRVSRATWFNWARAAYCPAPVRIGGGTSRIVRWVATELREWCEAGCPTREIWTARRRARG
jgi:predicted DNA-binding transcriptional regulator AlpA